MASPVLSLASLPNLPLQTRSSASGSVPVVNVQQDNSGNVTSNGSLIVFGVPVDNIGMLKIMKRVIVVAAIVATFHTCHFVVNLLRGAYSKNTDGTNSLWTATSSLMIDLSIPACGYYGALHGNRQLTCCFCSCNLFITAVTLFAFVRLHMRVAQLGGECDKERTVKQQETCEIWTSDGVDKYMMVTTTIATIFLGCLAFLFGNSLYQRLSLDFINAGPPLLPLLGEVISLAPQTATGRDPAPPSQQPSAPSVVETSSTAADGSTASAPLESAPAPGESQPG